MADRFTTEDLNKFIGELDEGGHANLFGELLDAQIRKCESLGWEHHPQGGRSRLWNLKRLDRTAPFPWPPAKFRRGGCNGLTVGFG